MAIKMSFKTRGVVANNGYFRLAQSNIDHIAKTGQLTFNAYFDEAARQEDQIQNVLTQKSYLITPVNYDSYFVGTVDIRAQGYNMAKAMKEVDSGTLDKDGNKVLVSYFNSGIDV